VLTLDWNIFWIVVNIIILFILLRIFLFKPINNIMEKREALITNEINEAETKNKQAEELKVQYEDSLKNAKDESLQIVNSAKERAQVQYDQIVEKANEDAANIVQQANKAAQADRDQMMREAHAELADLALAAASKVLGSSVESDANRKMLDDFLSEEG
jgi:F-type H+-transporting ATPase subunit b